MSSSSPTSLFPRSSSWIAVRVSESRLFITFSGHSACSRSHNFLCSSLCDPAISGKTKVPQHVRKGQLPRTTRLHSAFIRNEHNFGRLRNAILVGASLERWFGTPTLFCVQRECESASSCLVGARWRRGASASSQMLSAPPSLFCSLSAFSSSLLICVRVWKIKNNERGL